MIDLNVLKRQIEEAIPWRDGVLTVAQARALIQEIELLRAEAKVRDNITTSLDTELAQSRATVARLMQKLVAERAAVVAFMRATPEVEFDELPERIERGEHRKEQP